MGPTPSSFNSLLFSTLYQTWWQSWENLQNYKCWKGARKICSFVNSPIFVLIFCRGFKVKVNKKNISCRAPPLEFRALVLISKFGLGIGTQPMPMHRSGVRGFPIVSYVGWNVVPCAMGWGLPFWFQNCFCFKFLTLRNTACKIWPPLNHKGPPLWWKIWKIVGLLT